MGGHQCPGPVETLAFETDGQTAVLLLLDELIGAVVPDLDASRTVLTCGDLTLEGRVVEWMVLDMDGEGLLPGLERNALRDRPACEGAVALEPEVVVQSARVVTLDDEDRLLRLFPLFTERLRRLLRIPLPLVLGEFVGHQETLPDTRRSVRFNSEPIG